MTSTVRSGVASVIEAGTIEIRRFAGAPSGLHPRRFPLDRTSSVGASFPEILLKEQAGDLPYLPESVVRGVLFIGTGGTRPLFDQPSDEIFYLSNDGRPMCGDDPCEEFRRDGALKRPPKGPSKETGYSFGKRVRRTAPPVTSTSSQRFFSGALSRSDMKTLSWWSPT
jgi:hypothetical protein